MSKWQWYSVKLIFEFFISGMTNAAKLDKNHTTNNKTYEESIVLVKAQSFDHAYKIATRNAKLIESEHKNPYGESVQCRFVEAIDCFVVGDGELKSGSEIYSRFIRVPLSTKTKDFLDQYYPETIEDDSGIEYNYVLRNKEFN
jgi:hypothetical protein